MAWVGVQRVWGAVRSGPFSGGSIERCGLGFRVCGLGYKVMDSV